MENKYIKHIIDEYLNNQYTEEMEEKICSWLVEKENAEEKNQALEAYWNQLHVDPDIFLYDSLAQVKERIDELPQIMAQLQQEEPETAVVEESQPEKAGEINLPVIQLSAQDAVETPLQPEEAIQTIHTPVATQQEIPTIVDKPQEVRPQPVIQLKEESSGPALTRPSASSWESEEVLTGMSFIEEEENNRSVRWWKVVAVLIPFIALLAGGYYFYLNREPVAENWLTLTVPCGENSQVELPDGSIIWLNAGSTLRYPDKFTTGSRTVYLTGEAYFTVTKDMAKPFRVETSGLTVEVLGTEFNLMAYPGEERTVATLTSGKIQVQTSSNETYILQTNQQLSYNNQTAEAELQTLDELEGMEWKKGELVFKEQSLPAITRVLERKYNIRFTIEEAILEKEENYTVKFLNNETIEEVMNVLKEIAGFSWEKDAETILISNHS